METARIERRGGAEDGEREKKKHSSEWREGEEEA